MEEKQMSEEKQMPVMAVTDLEKFRRHMARPVKFTVENDGQKDEFEIKPLGIELFSEFMLISERLDSEPESKMMTELIGLYIKIMENTYPGIEYDMAYNFLVLNMNDFTEALQKVMPSKMNDEQKEALKKKLKEMQDAKSKRKDTQ